MVDAGPSIDRLSRGIGGLDTMHGSFVGSHMNSRRAADRFCMVDTNPEMSNPEHQQQTGDLHKAKPTEEDRACCCCWKGWRRPRGTAVPPAPAGHPRHHTSRPRATGGRGVNSSSSTSTGGGYARAQPWWPSCCWGPRSCSPAPSWARAARRPRGSRSSGAGLGRPGASRGSGRRWCR